MSDKKQSVALSSVLAGLALTAMKLVVGLVTGSMGIISEAAHSALDLGAAFLTFFAVKIGDRPADEDHPYGHGKVESVSALIETGLLFLTSFWIIYEAVHRLMTAKTEVDVTWYAFVVVALSIIIDVSRSRALSRVAKETHSQALEADALHFSSDIYSSAVVLLGLIFTMLGMSWVDSFAAIIVALFVFVAGWRMGKRTINALVDTAPPEISSKIIDLVQVVPGVISVERVRIRPVGPLTFVDISVVADRRLPTTQINLLVHSVENKIKEVFAETDVVVHIRAGSFDSESIIDKVRVLSDKHGLSVHDIMTDTLDAKKYISFDVEVDDKLKLKEAHDKVTALEDELMLELGSGVEINSHIEPMRGEAILSSNVDKNEMDKILSVLDRSDKNIEEIKNIHNVLVRKIDDKYFVSFHCNAPADMSIETVHAATARFEYLMRQDEDKIKSVVVHVEPE